MDKIIQFDRVARKKQKGKKIKFKIKTVIAIIATICGITGITARDVVNNLFEKDWQSIAEQYNNEGLELYNSGEYESAIRLYTKAIDLEGKEIDHIEVCYYNRGRAYYKLGDYEKAIGDYSEAINIAPKKKYYSQRALAYKMIGDTENELLDNINAITSVLE